MGKNIWNVALIGTSAVLMLLVSACRDTPAEQAAEEVLYVENPLDHVNPFIGTAPLTDPEFIGYTPPEGWRVWAGLTFPGSALPNAMVRLSPITQYGSGAGDEYEDNESMGFTYTNQGQRNLCNIPIRPGSGEA